MSRTPRFGRRLGGLAAVAAIMTAVGVPLTASASPSSRGPSGLSAAAAGKTYGGRTSQGFPIVIELSKNQRRVVQGVAALSLPCTSGNFYVNWDRWINVPVNRRRKFRTGFGRDTQSYDDGTTSKFESRMSGALNRARSKVSGRWQLKVTFYDNAGALTDTCSVSVSWTAKQ